ncbi:hypothetical protein [Nocardioides ultimimeridianus]
MKALLALAVMVLVAGCGAADPPATDPPPTVSTSSAPPAKPLSPEQTVRAWVRAYNDIARSGDGTLDSDLKTADCGTCDRLTGSLAETINAGGAYRGGQWQVVRTHLKSQSKAKAVVDALITMAAGSIRDRAGAGFRHFDAERDIIEFHLDNEGGRWYVSFIGWLS